MAWVNMKTADFCFDLPKELIAQEPSLKRDEARLLLVERATDTVYHRKFSDLVDYLQPEDVLVLNDTRVIPARLWLQREQGNAPVEILLIRPLSDNEWICYVSPGKKARTGHRLKHASNLLEAEVKEMLPDGERIIHFEWSRSGSFLSLLEEIGKTPLPPYIMSNPDVWKDYYQTVYAANSGSVAAPTAGLHFTEELLKTIQDRGTAVVYLTLHIGPGTFKPVHVEDIDMHRMDEEFYQISEETAHLINQRRARGGKCIAVGTTVTRTLESMAQHGKVIPGAGSTSLFIRPGFKYQIVDRLITNFHLPGSTLIMLVSAFYSREKVLDLYQEAIDKAYHFYSFGDAMMLL